jgi:hypothetical protein
VPGGRMNGMRGSHIKAVQRDDHTEITVLQPCTVAWSVDNCTWHTLRDADEVCRTGGVFRDYEAPLGHPRLYTATVDGRTVQWVPTNEAAFVAFADMMEPWFPSRRGHG